MRLIYLIWHLPLRTLRRCGDMPFLQWTQTGGVHPLQSPRLGGSTLLTAALGGIDVENRIQRAETGHCAENQQHSDNGKHNLPDAGQPKEAEQKHQQADAKTNVAVKDAFIDR